MKANVPAGIAILVSSWLSYSVCLWWVIQEWKDRLNEVFPRVGQKPSQFIRQRSRFLFLFYLVTLTFISTAPQRTLNTVEYVLHEKVLTRRGQLYLVHTTNIMTTFIYLLQAWRMRLHHQYYVVIANSDWTKLLDSNIEGGISFWLRYKSLLTSEKVTAAMIGVFFVIYCLLLAVLGNNWTLMSTVLVTIMFLNALATLAMLWRIPENSTYLRFELIFNACATIAAVIAGGLSVNFSPNVQTAVTVNQFLLVIANIGQFLSSFILAPRWSREKQAIEQEKENSRTSSFDLQSSARERVFNVMSDAQMLSDFMKYCCENWCSENVLAMLEILQFKRSLRKQMKSHTRQANGAKIPLLTVGASLMKHRPGRSTSTAGSSETSNSPSQTDSEKVSPILKPNLVSSPSGSGFSESSDLSAKMQAHSELMEQARQTEHFPQSAFFDESLCSWDLHCKVSLSQLGCQSSIVSNKDRTLSDKARLLCEKYFEYTSQYCVNVSESSRRVILSLVGEHSTVADSLDSLVFLFLFDEAVKDLIDNLNDSLFRFLASLDQ